MKNLFKISIVSTLILFQLSCKTQIDISPKNANIMVPAKGELKLFDNTTHGSFLINIKNNSTKNSCEVYKVKNGNKKWISPSLPVNGELNFSVPENGSVIIENYSEENISITYTIE